MGRPGEPGDRWWVPDTNPAPIPVNLGTERPILFDHRGTPIVAERLIGFKSKDRKRSSHG